MFRSVAVSDSVCLRCCPARQFVVRLCMQICYYFFCFCFFDESSMKIDGKVGKLDIVQDHLEKSNKPVMRLLAFCMTYPAVGIMT